MKKKNDFQQLKDTKKEAKEALFERCWKDESTKSPLLVIFDSTDHQAREVLFKLMEGLLVLPFKVIAISKEERADLVKHPSGRVTWINTENGRNDPQIDKYLLASDMALVMDEHHDLLERIMKKGVVVIGHEKSPLLENYHPNEETGNSFTFKSNNAWDIFMALVRALETYKFPYDWDHIIRSLV